MPEFIEVPGPPPEDVVEGIVQGVGREWEELVLSIWNQACYATAQAIFEQLPDDIPSLSVAVPVVDPKSVPNSFVWAQALAMARMAKLAMPYDEFADSKEDNDAE